jgi:hypothetical protein
MWANYLLVKHDEKTKSGPSNAKHLDDFKKNI